jgi:hypothetical protein
MRIIKNVYILKERNCHAIRWEISHPAYRVQHRGLGARTQHRAAGVSVASLSCLTELLCSDSGLEPLRGEQELHLADSVPEIWALLPEETAPSHR